MRSSLKKSKQTSKPSIVSQNLLSTKQTQKSVLDPKNPPDRASITPERIQVSTSESMRSTPSSAQLLTDLQCSARSQKSKIKQTVPKTIPNFERIESTSPINSSIKNKEKILRKENRSQTAVNTPERGAEINGFQSAAECVERRLNRNKTEIQKVNPNNHVNGEILHNYSNDRLSSNYKNEKVFGRVIQKEKGLQKSEVLVQDVKFKQEDTERIDVKKNSKSFNSYLRDGRRPSITSNASLNSFVISDTQFDLLRELTMSVKELNQRLVKSEEVTYERLKENLALKSKIKSLETKIEDQKGNRLDTEGIRPGCSTGCSLF